ncbi:MAG: hypothetical protein L0G49_07100 [Luteococcus sp.]|nr:hypothetical protein [Luteococcus sp.]
MDPAAPIIAIAGLTDLAMSLAIVGMLEWLWRSRWSARFHAVRPAVEAPTTVKACTSPTTSACPTSTPVTS